MTARPILMSKPMVQAILAGTKLQTRRPLRNGTWFTEEHGVIRQASVGLACTGFAPVVCPYGQPGDRLRVKEAAWMWCERRPNGKTKTGREKWLYVPMREAGIFYAADHPDKPVVGVVAPDTGNAWGWRLKIGGSRQLGPAASR